MIRLRKLRSSAVGGIDSAPRRRRIESGVRHPQRTEYLALAETVKALVGYTLQRNRQNDESDVAVFGFRAGISCQWSSERHRQQFISCSSP